MRGALLFLAVAFIGCADVPHEADAAVEPRADIQLRDEAGALPREHEAGPGAGPPRHASEPATSAPARLPLDENVKITFDGNSLLVYGAPTMPALVATLLAARGRAPETQNVGVSAQSIRMLAGFDGGDASDVDAAWAPGKTNVLVVWEATNSIAYYGRSLADATADLTAYITARQAVHPWRVVLMTCLPRYETGNDGLLVAWNTLARMHYREWGADALVDVRAPGSPFAFDGTVAANFQATQRYWAETASWVHLNGEGNAVIAEMVVEALERLPARTDAPAL